MGSITSYQRVISTGVKRVTFENPDKGQKAALKDSILAIGMASVGGACGVETTGGRPKRRNTELI